MANSVEIPKENEATTTSVNGANGVAGRRIVKAATPKASETGTNGGAYSYTGPETPTGLKSSNDDEDFVPIGKKNRRDEEDDQEKWRNNRLKTTEKRGKALREKELQARRQANTVNKEANASGNPFSRFLSVFSVESQHPEHKRSFEASTEDDGEGPSEKRLKPTDPMDISERIFGGDAPPSLFSSKAFWITTAVTVAVGVAFAVQRGRTK